VGDAPTRNLRNQLEGRFGRSSRGRVVGSGCDLGFGQRALALLDAACGPFESIGMPGWLRRAEELRQQLGRHYFRT
jgi:hypothetical protein